VRNWSSVAFRNRLTRFARTLAASAAPIMPGICGRQYGVSNKVNCNGNFFGADEVWIGAGMRDILTMRRKGDNAC
jgi:hypothetical protein